MSQLKIIHDFPAFRVLEARSAYKPDDVLYITGQRYKLNDVMSYALANNRCPIELHQESITKGEQVYWLIPKSVTLTSHKQAQGVCYQAAPGDVIKYAGKFLKIVPACNDNYNLVIQE